MSKIIDWLKGNVSLLIILLIAAALRLYHVNYQSLWLDEIHTINESNPALTLKELYKTLCEADPHPPLYFLLVRCCFWLFGYTALTMRLLSACLGIAGVWSIYILGKELYNKKAGLTGALLVAVNYFHIYYSQDARPYPLLFLCTTISFYFLVKFIKNPTGLTSLLYGFFTGLMLYSHLFSLFALCSQVLILLYFIIRPSANITVKKMFVYCFLSGVVVTIMYLPCLEILFLAASRTSIWIPKPKPDVYIDLIEEFFGNYDNQLYLAGIALIFFFKGLINERHKKTGASLLKFCSILLLTWIIITLLIPFVKSYIGLPLIVSRYFINILPAIILLIAIGIVQIKKAVFRYFIVGTMVVLSLYNIFILKDYYNTITKTQFREATNFIIDNNKNDALVVSYLGWYMPFYLHNGTQDYTIIKMSLDEYIEQKMTDTSSIEPFWYLDGHNRAFNASIKVKEFLNSNYNVQTSYDGYDIWVKYYKPVNSNYTVKKRYKNIGDAIRSSIDRFEIINNVLYIKGWAFLNGIEAGGSEIKVCLMKNGKPVIIPTVMHSRWDVSDHLKLNYNVDNSGFTCEYDLRVLKKGSYQLGIFVENKIKNKKGLILTDKEFIR